MYGLPKDTDLNFIISSKLEQICFGVSQVILRFTSSTTLTIESKFDLILSVDATPLTWQPNTYAIFTALGTMLGTSISGYAIQNSKLMILTFACGKALRLYDSNIDYESFQLTGNGFNLIV